jgi:hypothetical protein
LGNHSALKYAAVVLRELHLLTYSYGYVTYVPVALSEVFTTRLSVLVLSVAPDSV